MPDPEPSWLRVFEGKALAAALTEAGHDVSEKTVQRWKAGQTRPKPQDIRAIRQLIGAETQQNAAPEWARRMADEVVRQIEQMITGTGDLGMPSLPEKVGDRLAVRLGLQQTRHDEPSHEAASAPPGTSRKAPRPKR